MTNATVQELMTGIYNPPKRPIEGHFINHWIKPKEEKSNSSPSNK